MSKIEWLRPSGSKITTENTENMVDYAKSAGWKRVEEKVEEEKLEEKKKPKKPKKW